MTAPKTPALKAASKAPAAKPAAKTAPKEHGHRMLAIVRVRGPVRAGPVAMRALNEFGLVKKNWCAIMPDVQSTRSLLIMAKDYATWGPLDASTQQALAKARGERKVYTLSPPRKGYAKKSIKIPFTQGGALGSRGEAINNLVMRMI
jgi:large subunit ribosomal protein L30